MATVTINISEETLYAAIEGLMYYEASFCNEGDECHLAAVNELGRVRDRAIHLGLIKEKKSV